MNRISQLARRIANGTATAADYIEAHALAAQASARKVGA